jgi:hypothetical protein
MLRRASLIAGAVLAFVVAGVGATRSQLPAESLVLSGWVRVATAPNGLATVVTVANGITNAAGQDVAQTAFRVQFAKPHALKYDGPGMIVFYTKGLRVHAASGQTWEFVVTDQILSGQGQVLYQPIAVFGLSRHSETATNQAADEWSAALLAEVCGVSRLDSGESGDCSVCQDGGSGEAFCHVDCGGGSYCSASCLPGYRSCCNCPRNCTCCPEEIQTGAAPRPR